MISRSVLSTCFLAGYISWRFHLLQNIITFLTYVVRFFLFRQISKWIWNRDHLLNFSRLKFKKALRHGLCRLKIMRVSAASPRGRPPGTQGHLSQQPWQIHAKAPPVGQKIGTNTPTPGATWATYYKYLKKKNSPVLLAKKKKRITPAQEKWENNHFKEKVRVKTGMTNYLFQSNQQNKTKGLIQLHHVSFEDLISVTKYEKRWNYAGWQKTDNHTERFTMLIMIIILTLTKSNFWN